MRSENHYLRAAGIDSPIGYIKPETKELESKGALVWLRTIFPFAFEEEFSEDHKRFWTLYYSVLLRIRKQKEYKFFGLPIPQKYKIAPKEYVILLILGRALGKSATLEASNVMRGAVLDGGYCLYVCESQDQADEHIGNSKSLIKHPDSRLTEFYPGMEIIEGAIVEGIKTKDRTDLFTTANGWICRAKGLNAKLRGIRMGNRRPDDICIDDIDSEDDSPAVAQKKLRKLTSAVIPTQARAYVTIKFGQNLIAENSVMNQIYTGRADAFAERTTIGVTNTFIRFEYESYIDTSEGDDFGRVKHRILPTSIPSWSGVDIEAAQKFLNDSGLETFLAEYQNQFEHLKTGKVFHEYDEARHVITWSQFEKVFGCRYIPQQWQVKAAGDLGFSKLSLSAWAFVATSSKHSALPGHYFLYRGLTFDRVSIDDQALTIWEELFPKPELGKMHFEASQKFVDYPDLFRYFNTKPELKPFLSKYVYNAREDKFEPELPEHLIQSPEEHKALFYVKEAAKNFRSQINYWVVSHERTSEQMTLAKRYGLPVHKTKHFGANDGVSEVNNLLRGTYTRPHPFHEDKPVLDENGNPTGRYKLGCPFLFFIVDDDQLKAPRDDRGLKNFRKQIASQRMTQEKLTDLGLTRSIPMKYESDCGDALRMWGADYAVPGATALSIAAEFEEVLADAGRVHEGEIITPERQMQILLEREIAEQKIQELYNLTEEDFDEVMEEDFLYDDW